MRPKARSKLQNADVAFQVATAEHLPFPAGQFDVVTAITILCFVDHAAPVFREIARVLRPRGRRHRRAWQVEYVVSRASPSRLARFATVAPGAVPDGE